MSIADLGGPDGMIKMGGLKTTGNGPGRTYSQPLNPLGHAWGSVPPGVDYMLTRHGGELAVQQLRTRLVPSDFVEVEDRYRNTLLTPIVSLLLPLFSPTCTLLLHWQLLSTFAPVFA